MITSGQQAIIFNFLQEKVSGMSAVYLYGSRSDDDDTYVRPNSDYDVAFLASHVPTFTTYEKFLLKGALAALLKTE